ncbi:unnamed protein product, partial [Staurois parvus]
WCAVSLRHSGSPINGKSRSCQLDHVISCVQSQLIASVELPVSAIYQCCQSVPPISARQCRLSVPVSAAYKCHLSVLPISDAYQCPSVPPISARQCRLSVPPISAIYE